VRSRLASLRSGVRTPGRSWKWRQRGGSCWVRVPARDARRIRPRFSASALREHTVVVLHVLTRFLRPRSSRVAARRVPLSQRQSLPRRACRASAAPPRAVAAPPLPRRVPRPAGVRRGARMLRLCAPALVRRHRFSATRSRRTPAARPPSTAPTASPACPLAATRGRCVALGVRSSTE